MHLDSEVRLVPQHTGETVRGKLAPYVQPILNEVGAELLVQGFLSVQIV